MFVAGWVWVLTAVRAACVSVTWLMMHKARVTQEIARQALRCSRNLGDGNAWSGQRRAYSRRPLRQPFWWPLARPPRWPSLLKRLVEARPTEASRPLPSIFLGINGHALLIFGILFAFGLPSDWLSSQAEKHARTPHYARDLRTDLRDLQDLPFTQGKFLILLETFITVVIVLYFGVLLHYEAVRVFVIFLFSVLGIAGSYGVAWFGIRVNTFANSRTAFAGLAGSLIPSTTFR